MILLCACKTELRVKRGEPLTSGSVNVYRVRFGFSEAWEGLERTAVFKGGGEMRSMLLDESSECAIPWEVLAKPNAALQVGVYGTQGGNVVLPTVWASLGIIQEGAAPGEAARPPTPELWQQELARKADRMDYTPDGSLGLYAGDKLLSAVPVSGGGEGGTADHRLLLNRDAEDQHPVNAVTGLAAALASIPVPMTADQLRKILMNGGQEYA